MSGWGGSGEARRRRIAESVLRPFLEDRDRRQVVSDLEELRTHRLAEGRAVAGLRWWLDLLRFPVALWVQRSAVSPEEVHGSGGGVSGFAGAVLYDVRHAVRRLWRNPPYTFSVLATLTVTIGAATAVFSALNGVLLRPLPHPEPDRLVRLYEVDQRGASAEDRNPVAVANYVDWAVMNTTLESMAAFTTFDGTLSVEGVPERVPIAQVTAEFLELIGVEPVLGRGFTASEYDGADGSAVMLGYDYWQRRFGGNRGIIGEVLESGGRQYTVVGVLPRGFRFLERDHDVWLPWAFTESARQNRRSHYLAVIARLSPGVSIERTQADMDRVVDQLRPAHPEFLDGWGVNVVPLMDDIVGSAKPALLLLFVAVGFVVVLGGVNIAAATVTRAMEASHETDVRRAIGATGARLMRERVMEGMLLAVAGCAAGVGLAVVATRGLLALAPDSLPRANAIGVDPVVLLFAIGVSIATVLSGTVITYRTAIGGLADNLRAAGRSVTASRARRRWQAVFIGSQIALSLTLLVSAGLMLRSLSSLMAVDPGFDAAETVTVRVQLPGSRYTTAPTQGPVYDALLDSVQAVPGVTAAGVTNYLPMTDAEGTWSIQIAGQPEPRAGEKRDYGRHLVSPGYFEAMGMRIVRGRGITLEDRAGRPLVTVVNESLVRRFFEPGEDPIGQRMHLFAEPADTFEIVGVVSDVHLASLDAEPTGAYYLPYRQLSDVYWNGAARLVARTGTPAAGIAAVVHNAARNIDPDILIHDVRTMADRVAASASVTRTRFVTMLLGVFGAVALALTAIGVGGAVTQWTRQRRREIGIRMTMGATPGGVVGGLLRESGTIVAGGLVAGLAGAIAFARVQSALLFGVTPLDARTYVAAAVLVAGGALVATLVPAARAGRTDPAAIMRSEQ
jgi:putative ABC transport system permease protein